jgi:replicative superfamily II helicase
MADRTKAKGFVMTPEDEEFNRIEMESRIKQEYVRDMNKKSTHDYLHLMEELTFARALIRELGDRLAKLEKTWVGLTEEEIKYLLSISDNEEDFAYAIERKLKEKNA